MGDFNVKMSVLDVAENVCLKQDTSRAALQNFMYQNDFCDLWRYLHPTVREFSRIQIHQKTLRQSRIDLCLVKKSLLFLFSTMSHNLNFVSDHVFLRVGMGIQRRGRGGDVWHFNARLLLNKDYVQCISELISFESSKGYF